MTRIVFLDRATIGPTINLARPNAPHEWADYPTTSSDQVVARLQGAEIAITNKVPLRRKHLEHLPDLKFIAVAATGYDVIDIDACRERGITVSNVRGYAVHSVPEHVMALILALKRQLPGYREDVIKGDWARSGQFCFFNHPIEDLAGKTLGIIGGGSIGQSVARLAQAFGMRVIFAARKGEAATSTRIGFDDFLAESDVITLHCPLNAETIGLIGAEEFSKMARRPVLINTARGGLVDEVAAVNALKRKNISGIGFDVTTPEPPLPDNPLMGIADLPNVILTPHVAWASDEAMTALWAQVIEGIDAFIAGTPKRILT
ncbi:D-2-hydroxyacid dehydrogenase [Albirhodobacter sp. R86504]|uniref:D-2-hydroxyacid dehydrogenase n=1 Tax=Albirhodobacter sp. R86504 TaxID=3093848 RepID=UPI00366A777F